MVPVFILFFTERYSCSIYGKLCFYNCNAVNDWFKVVEIWNLISEFAVKIWCVSIACHLYIHIRIHIHTHTYIHIYAYAYVYIHIYTCVYVAPLYIKPFLRFHLKQHCSIVSPLQLQQFTLLQLVDNAATCVPVLLSIRNI